MKKKIIIITSNRSDYGIQKNLIKLLKQDKKINLKLLVTGSHLLQKFGFTKNEIINDKISISREIPFRLKNFSHKEIINYISLAVSKFSNFYIKYKPDLIIILGDRYEMLAAALPSIFLNIPIAHLHGGEITLGSFDNTIRNCITQMSTLHFTCHKKYMHRVIRMGKNPKLVYNVGSLACENIKKTKFFSKKFLEKKFKFKFAKKNALVTFHPITIKGNVSSYYFSNLIKVLKKYKEMNFLFTCPAPDPENSQIMKLLDKNVKKNKNFFLIKSFGQKYYHSIIKNISFVIGNSSSGIIEVPSFKKPTINIGDRQKGREQGKSIINCSYLTKSIEKAIGRISSKKFLKNLKNQKNIFYKKNTSTNISKAIKNFLDE